MTPCPRARDGGEESKGARGPKGVITTVAISGYRSLRDVVLPLSALTVITGANGTGKSSVYRSLRLLADIADDRIIGSLAREGGFESVLWAGPEVISTGMREGSTPIQGTVRRKPVALKLGFAEDDLSYAIELGLPVPLGTSLFNGDPEIKREVVWTGEKPTPARVIADRRGPRVQARGAAGGAPAGLRSIRTDMRPYDSLVRHLIGPDAPWEVASLRERLGTWRFYDHFRTDDAAPARRPQVGTRTTALSPTGADLAAAVQTIREIGDGRALDAAVDQAFPGARVEVGADGGLFQLVMCQRGMLRPLAVSELSDGTLRFLLLAVALLTPRPAPLLVVNEPETSLHGDLIPALAALIARAGDDGQVIVVSHERTLVRSLRDAGASLIELYKNTGETIADASEFATWTWPRR